MDGSAPGGAIPSRLPGPRHGARWLRACSPSRSDRSGTRKAAAGRSITYIRPGPRLRSIAAAKEALDFAFELRHGRIDRFPPRIDDYRPPGIQPIQMQADGLADPPPDAVTRHGLAEGAGQSKADARSDGLRFAKTKRGKQRARVTVARIVNSSEIFRFEQPDTFRKTCDGGLPFGTHSQFLAAAGAPARKNGPAILGFHARTETMGFRPVAIVWLKSALRHWDSSTYYKAGGRSRANRIADRPGISSAGAGGRRYFKPFPAACSARTAAERNSRKGIGSLRRGTASRASRSASLASPGRRPSPLPGRWGQRSRSSTIYA